VFDFRVEKEVLGSGPPVIDGVEVVWLADQGAGSTMPAMEDFVDDEPQVRWVPAISQPYHLYHLLICNLTKTHIGIRQNVRAVPRPLPVHLPSCFPAHSLFPGRPLRLPLHWSVVLLRLRVLTFLSIFLLGVPFHDYSLKASLIIVILTFHSRQRPHRRHVRPLALPLRLLPRRHRRRLRPHTHRSRSRA
jgi:hypothetical protein